MTRITPAVDRGLPLLPHRLLLRLPLPHRKMSTCAWPPCPGSSTARVCPRVVPVTTSTCERSEHDTISRDKGQCAQITVTTAHNPGPRPSHVFKLGLLAVLPRLRRSAHRLLPLSMSGKRCRGSVGRCTGTQGEWAQEHARLARARDEWESRENAAKKSLEGSGPAGTIAKGRCCDSGGHHSHHAQSPRHYYSNTH
jgi:hypothetical protein